MRRIVIASQKGGVAKSTTATCLAVGLARRGHSTLLIDADGQGSATFTAMRGAEVAGPTLADVLLRHALVDEAIRPTHTPGLDLLPADASLNGAAVALVQEVGRDARLRSAMASVEGRWDFVIVDTPPAFSTILANALVFGHEIIVPIDAAMYAMLGLAQLQATIGEVKEAYGNAALHLAGLVLTRVARNNTTRDIEAGLRERFGDLVFKSVVPLSAKVEEACTRGLTVLEHAPKSPAAIAYDQLILEIEHGGRAEVRGRGVGIGRPGAVDAA
jgi:chromosome partitioning protein